MTAAPGADRTRILFVSDRLSDRGGADHHLLQMAAAARDGGWDVTLMVDRVGRRVCPPAGVRLVRRRGLGDAFGSRLDRSGLAATLAAADIVHVQNVMNPVALELLVAHGRTVVTIQDHRVLCPGPGKTLPDGRPCGTPFPEADCSRCLEDGSYRERMLDLTRRRRDAVRRAACRVVLSRYMATELERAGGGSAERLPPWVAVGAPRERAGDAVALVGRLVAHKAPLDAWAGWCLAGRPLPLRVAGEGALAAQLEGAERFGWLDPDDLRHTLRAARMLVFPARWQEPFGIAGVEALAEGTPVVVAAAGGNGDWSDAGCLEVTPGDVAAMADAISRLASAPERALALGREGQRMVARRYARARLEPRLFELWRRVRDLRP